MAITLDPTPNGASANSYGTLAEALAYFDSRLGGGAFRDTNDAEVQKQVLIIGTREIDQELFRGARATAEQALQWGRVDTYAAGHPIDPNIIPAFVKFASFEQGLFRLEQAGADYDVNPLGAAGTEELKSLGVGPVRLEFRDRDSDAGRAADDSSRALAPQAYRFLRAYIITEAAMVQPESSVRNFSIYH